MSKTTIKKDYNKIAEEQLKNRNIELAIEYYKRSLNKNPDQLDIIDKIDSIGSRLDFTKCCCKGPGYCPRYHKEMEDNPPNWKWCQEASSLERKEHYEQSLVNHLKLELGLPKKYIRQLIYNTDIDDSKDFNTLLKKYKAKAHMFFSNPGIPQIIKENKSSVFVELYYLTTTEKRHICQLASRNQRRINKNIIAFHKKYSTKPADYGNIEILCLGHSNEQFKLIEDKPYLTKINLNNIDAGKYSENAWSESRAFIAEGLFKKNTEFVGLTTASWNKKYEPFNFIDEFETWEYSSVLLNSKPEDKIVLCADTFCACAWINPKTNNDNKPLLSGFFTDKEKIIGDYVLKTFDLRGFNHIKVPYGNQMILHKQNYFRYLDFLKEKDVFAKVKWFSDKYCYKYLHTNDPLKSEYQNTRIYGYFMEMIACLWFSMQGFTIIPCTELKNDWYSYEDIAYRLKNWKKHNV